MLPRFRLLIAIACLGLVVGCSSETDVKTQPAAAATVPASLATVPSGWIVHRGPGFTVALPPDWIDRPKEQRAAPSAPMEVGVPFTGQPVPPPVFMGFVEQAQVGPLELREKVLRMQIQAGLPEGTTLGHSEHLKVAGSVDATSFDVVYPESGGVSVLGTPLKDTTMRQRELIVETPGLPKFGFRYAAPEEQFDLSLWKAIVASLSVNPAAVPSATSQAN